MGRLETALPKAKPLSVPGLPELRAYFAGAPASEVEIFFLDSSPLVIIAKKWLARSRRVPLPKQRSISDHFEILRKIQGDAIELQITFPKGNDSFRPPCAALRGCANQASCRTSREEGKPETEEPIV
jgi:hypothetical protein